MKYKDFCKERKLINEGQAAGSTAELLGKKQSEAIKSKIKPFDDETINHAGQGTASIALSNYDAAKPETHKPALEKLEKIFGKGNIILDASERDKENIDIYGPKISKKDLIFIKATAVTPGAPDVGINGKSYYYSIKNNYGTTRAGGKNKPTAESYEMGIAVAFNLYKINGDSINESPSDEELDQALINASITSADLKKFKNFKVELLSIGNKVVDTLPGTIISKMGGSLQYFGKSDIKHIKNWGIGLLQPKNNNSSPAAGVVPVQFESGADQPKTDILGGVHVSLKMGAKMQDKTSGAGSQLLSGDLKKDTSGVLFSAIQYFQAENPSKSIKLAEAFIQIVKDRKDETTTKLKKHNASSGTLRVVKAYFIYRLDNLKNDKVIKKLIGEKSIDIKTLTTPKTTKSPSVQKVINHLKSEMNSSKEIKPFMSKNDGDKFIKGASTASPQEVSTWWRTYQEELDNAHKADVKDDLVKILNIKRLEKEFEPKLKEITEDSKFKTYMVFEAATGCYKFSGKTLLKEALKSSQSAAIADYMLVFGPNGIEISESQMIDLAWAKKYSNKIKFKIRIKSASNRLALAMGSAEKTNAEMAAQNTVSEDVGNTVLDKYVNLIIDEEFKKHGLSLLEEGWISDTFTKSKKLISAFAKNLAAAAKAIWDRVINILAGWAKKGIGFLMDQMGFTIESDGDITGLDWLLT